MARMIGFLGTQKDSRGFNDKRWERFRPSVAACCNSDLSITHYYLIHDGESDSLLSLTMGDMQLVCPGLKVIPVLMKFDDAFEPVEVLKKQAEFILNLPESEYVINFTTGTVVSLVAWFELVKAKYINARIAQIYGVNVKFDKDIHIGHEHEIVKGKCRIIDLELAKYDIYHQLNDVIVSNDEDVLKQGIGTKNKQYNEMISMIERVAVTNNRPLLIDGPTGAGKTELAKMIFKLKSSKGVINGDFVYINCATLMPEHAQSALFGHTKGSFTGADKVRDGALWRANKGLLFLDEVATLPLSVQGMLLDAIETKKFKAMGSDDERTSDFVLICGTNVNLYEEVDCGRFREDLLARINLWHFSLPGLKDRPEDIDSNIDFELKKYSKEHGVNLRFNKEARQKFLKFARSPSSQWKYNFRDLNAAIERMGTLSESGVITEDVVTEEIGRLLSSWRVKSCDSDGVDFTSILLDEQQSVLSLIEKTKFNLVIKTCVDSKSAARAARVLYGINGDGGPKNPASLLSKYLDKYGLTYKTVIERVS